jgi:16S rRNA A1518/A1519 N6-dimethyltransferase RsmA/KsgA/DIM1 with predicted DNA glycosylase/AP lyase activity
MSVRIDPEENETRALFALADLANKHVLEIGSGDGRLTWRYAARARHVSAIEPFEPHFARATNSLPEALQGRVQFQNLPFEEFAAASPSSSFEVVILSWSLC